MKKFLLGLALGVLWPGIVLAAESAAITPEEASPLILSAESDRKQSGSGEVQTIEQIVVTPTGTEVPVKDTSVSSTTVTSQQIDARQATRLEEVLRGVPGVIVSQSGSTGGTTSLFVRGFDGRFMAFLFGGSMDITRSMLNLALGGGSWVLWLLISLSVISVIITVERALTFYRCRFQGEQFINDLVHAFQGADWPRGKTLCEDFRSLEPKSCWPAPTRSGMARKPFPK
jgi:hypothetical protein